MAAGTPGPESFGGILEEGHYYYCWTQQLIPMRHCEGRIEDEKYVHVHISVCLSTKIIRLSTVYERLTFVLSQFTQSIVWSCHVTFMCIVELTVCPVSCSRCHRLWLAAQCRSEAGQDVYWNT